MNSLKDLKYFINDEVASLPLPEAPERLYEPFRYILGIGGKRLRPAMLMLAGKAYHGTDSELRDAALAIEIFHNFSLVHDDIMDDAPKRRGKTTVHEKWDDSTAILVGDVMLIEAYRYLGRLSDRAFKPCFEVFTKAAKEVCEGQVLDMEFEQRDDVSIAEYLEMIRMKTAVLVGACLNMGAIIGGADKAEAEVMCQFGENLGLSFQLKDDYLDTFPDGENFGKKVGGDILANKKTYLYLCALENANADDKKELLQWFGSKEGVDPSEKIAKVTAIFERSGAKNATHSMMLHYYNLALDSLTETNMQENYKNQFEELAGFLTERVQ